MDKLEPRCSYKIVLIKKGGGGFCFSARKKRYPLVNTKWIYTGVYDNDNDNDALWCTFSH